MAFSKRTYRFVALLIATILLVTPMVTPIGYAETDVSKEEAQQTTQEGETPQEEPAVEEPQNNPQAETERNPVSDDVLATTSNLLEDLDRSEGTLKLPDLKELHYNTYPVDIKKDDLKWPLVIDNQEDTETIRLKVTELSGEKIPDNFKEKYSEGKLEKTDILILSSEMKSVGKNAFKDLVNLKMIVIANPEIKIDNNAFENCANLTYVRIDSNFKINGNENDEQQTESIDSNIKLDKNAFKDCAKKNKLIVYCQDDIWFRDKDIDSDAFKGTKYQISISQRARLSYSIDTRYIKNVVMRTESGEITVEPAEPKDNNDTPKASSNASSNESSNVTIISSGTIRRTPDFPCNFTEYTVDISKDDPRFASIVSDTGSTKLKVIELKGKPDIDSHFIEDYRKGNYTVEGTTFNKDMFDDADVLIFKKINYISYDAFKGLSKLKMVVLCNTGIEVWGSAFENCKNLRYVRVDKDFQLDNPSQKPTSAGSPDSNLKIKENAFAHCAQNSTLTLYCQDDIWPKDGDVKASAFNGTDYKISISKMAYNSYTHETRFASSGDHLLMREGDDEVNPYDIQEGKLDGGISYKSYYLKVKKDDPRFTMITDSNTPQERLLKITELEIDSWDASVPDNFIKDNEELLKYTDVLTLDIIGIGKDAFKGLNNLQMVVLNRLDVDIKEGAFENCSNLRYVLVDKYFSIRRQIPRSVGSPDSNIRLGKNAFAGCAKNSKLVLYCQNDFWPKNSEINDSAFGETNYNISISNRAYDTYDKDTRYDKNIDVRPGGGKILNAGNIEVGYTTVNYEIYYLDVSKNDPIYSDITATAETDTVRLKVTKLTTGDGYRRDKNTISENFLADYRAKKIDRDTGKYKKDKFDDTDLLIFDSEISCLRRNAFKDFSHLQMVMINDVGYNVRIEEGAFENCSNLKCIRFDMSEFKDEIPSKTGDFIRMSERAFAGCAKDSKLNIYCCGMTWFAKDNIKSDTFDGTNYQISISREAYDYYLQKKQRGTRYYKNLVVRDGNDVSEIKVIDKDSWSHPVWCKSYTTNVKEDETRWPLLTDRKALTNPEIPLKVTELSCEGNQLPEDFSSVAKEVMKDTNILVVDEGFVNIGKNAFKGLDKLKVAIIERPVITIEENAFQGCSHLWYVNFGGKFESVAEMQSFGKKWENYSLNSNIVLKNNAFAGCATNATETNKLLYFDCGTIVWPKYDDIHKDAFSGTKYLMGINQIHYGCHPTYVRYDKNIEYKTWGEDLPGDAKLVTEVSVPGSHDAGTYKATLAAQTQGLSLSDQWDKGVRFFDLRVAHTAKDQNDKSEMKIVHQSWYCHDKNGDDLTLHNAIKEIAYQVQKNNDFAIIQIIHQPYEFFVSNTDNCKNPSNYSKKTKEEKKDAYNNWWAGDMSIQQELAGWTKNSGDYINVAATPSNQFIHKSSSFEMKVKDLRGKILFIFNENDLICLPSETEDGFEIPITGCTSQGLEVITEKKRDGWAFTTVLMQNKCQFAKNIKNDSEEKLGYIKTMFDIYGQPKYSKYWCWNYTSCYFNLGFGIPDYESMASHINEKAATMVDNLNHSTGLLIMDFAGVYKAKNHAVNGDALLNAVIRHNFK